MPIEQKLHSPGCGLTHNGPGSSVHVTTVHSRVTLDTIVLPEVEEWAA